jgi:hypothetical protein
MTSMDDETGENARPADAARQPNPSAIPSSRNGPPPQDKLGEELSDYQASPNRKLQVTKRGYNRFDKEARKLFLKWFAATANAAQSARAAGVAKSTVYDHRMKDALFAEAWDRALEQSYARLEAKVLEMQFEQAAGEPIDFDGSFEPPDAAVVDMTTALMLLKQHKTEVTRIRGERDPAARRGKKVPPFERERLASDAEMRRALVKSLRAFGVRVTKEDLRGPAANQDSPSTGSGRSEG